MDANDELQPSAPGVPPGFPEPQTASQPAWQTPYTVPADSRPTWNGWQSQGHVSEFRVDTRNWKAPNLDMDAKPKGFRAWQYRALVHLSGNRIDVRRLLLWARNILGRSTQLQSGEAPTNAAWSTM